MFGKPEWFKQTACCHSVMPVTLKGWLYMAAWSALIVLPTAGLVALEKTLPEALVWLVAASLAFMWDMRDIRRQLQAAYDRSLYYIGGEEQESSELATRHFDMKLRG